jgi:hypothetical protein
MDDAIERFTRDVDDGFQPSYTDSIAALDALREALADAYRLCVERDALKRRIESTPPWPEDGKALDGEQMRALLKRWSTGPERYQADADAPIATAMAAIARAEAAERERDEVREALAICRKAHAGLDEMFYEERARLAPLRKVREAAEAIAHHAETATYPLTFMNGAAYRRSLHVALRAAIDAARGEGGSHE